MYTCQLQKRMYAAGVKTMSCLNVAYLWDES